MREDPASPQEDEGIVLAEMVQSERAGHQIVGLAAFVGERIACYKLNLGGKPGLPPAQSQAWPRWHRWHPRATSTGWPAPNSPSSAECLPPRCRDPAPGRTSRRQPLLEKPAHEAMTCQIAGLKTPGCANQLRARAKPVEDDPINSGECGSKTRFINTGLYFRSA